MTYEWQSYLLLQSLYFIINESVHTYSLLWIYFSLKQSKKSDLTAHAQAYQWRFHMLQPIASLNVTKIEFISPPPNTLSPSIAPSSSNNLFSSSFYPERKGVGKEELGNSLVVPWFSSVQFSRSVMSDSLRPHDSQHTRPPCPSPTPGVYPNSCALSW